MDIENLIEQLNDFNENHISVICGSGQCACGYLCDKDDCIVVRAATALSTLQAENESLRVLSELGNMRAKDYRVMRDRAVKAEAENAQLRAELEYEKEHANAYYEECGQWEAENTQLKEKLEALKQDRDFADKYELSEYGKTWLAYRRPPEGET